MLTQADGIAEESLGVGLYAKSKKGVPKTASAVREHREHHPNYFYLDIFLEPLQVSLPLTDAAAKRGSGSDLLNRHAVLHGVSVDYDTEVNSCRAISLLAYLSWAVRELARPIP